MLLIEDKTNTSEHSDQLKRYYKDVRDGRLENYTGIPETAAENIHAVCIKRGNQSLEDRKRVESQGYAVFDRKISCVSSNRTAAAMRSWLTFRSHLTRWQRETESFRKWDPRGR